MADIGNSTLIVEFGLYEFHEEAYKRAAYVFMKRANCSIRRSDDAVVCRIEPLAGTSTEGLATDFRREVLDQDLRISIEAKTEGVRNLVLGLAFSRVPRDDEVR